MESLHHGHDGNIRAFVDELMVRVGGVGPTPCVGEGVELRLTYLPARLAKQDVVIRVRVKRRIEINKIDTRIRELAPFAQPLQIVAEVQAVHSRNFIACYSERLAAASDLACKSERSCLARGNEVDAKTRNEGKQKSIAAGCVAHNLQ